VIRTTGAHAAVHVNFILKNRLLPLTMQQHFYGRTRYKMSTQHNNPSPFPPILSLALVSIMFHCCWGSQLFLRPQLSTHEDHGLAPLYKLRLIDLRTYTCQLTSTVVWF